MHNRYKVIAGSLLGAIAIHVTFVACGAGHQSGGARGADGGLLDAMRDAFSTLVGDGAGALAATDAEIGSCGCTGQAPIHSVTADTDSNQLVRGVISMPNTGGATMAKVVEGPFVLTDWSAWSYAILAQPALFPAAASCPAPTSGMCPDGLTDGATNYDCSPGTLLAPNAATLDYNDQPVTPVPTVSGMRWVVPSGQMLCVNLAAAAGNMGIHIAGTWAGFTPY